MAELHAGANKGRAFWVCSKVSKTAQCKFFKWDDELGVVQGAGAPVAGPSTSTAAATDKGGSCFKCGQQGHWSSKQDNPFHRFDYEDNTLIFPLCRIDKCTNQSQAGRNSSAVQALTNYTCFSCNEQGHLSTNCPKKGGDGGGSSSTTGQTCFHCHQVGAV